MLSGRSVAALTVLLIVIAMAVVAVGARPYAGGWNDGSRLAAVQSLVDHGTLAIDNSIFVKVPPDTVARGVPPFGEEWLNVHGTFDKLFIKGHYYSDKPAIISLVMAMLYEIWQWCGGAAAAERPDWFCLFMTWVTAGAAYLGALLFVYLLGKRLGLTPPQRLLLCVSLGAATVAPVYTRHVNNHILLLAVVAAVLWQLVGFGQDVERGQGWTWRLLLIGFLGGLGYALDLGLGPVLLASLALAVVGRIASPSTNPRTANPSYVCIRSLWLLGIGAVPWLAGHHALNFAIGGVIKPMNTVPEYSAWEGCPFNPSNMTGLAGHSGWSLVVYSAALLYGKHGFLAHNLPMLLAIPAAVMVWRTARSFRPEITFAVLFCAGGWLMYAVFSNNYGGPCCSIRWFVPFLAPAFLLIALLLRSYPAYALDLAVLSGWGCVLTLLLWLQGPWSNKAIIVYWPIQVLALASWWACRRWQGKAMVKENCVTDARSLGRAA